MRSPWLIPEIASGDLDEEELGGAKTHSSRVVLHALLPMMKEMRLTWR